MKVCYNWLADQGKQPEDVHSFHIGPGSKYHPNVLNDCTACQASPEDLGVLVF